MSFFMNRKYKLEKILYNINSKNPNKIGIVIIFLDEKDSPQIYRFYNNMYLSANLEEMKWTTQKHISDLTWEELKKIIPRIVFIDKGDEIKWINKRKNSFSLLLQDKLRKFILK